MKDIVQKRELGVVAQAANAAASASAFALYRQRKAEQTTRRQDADLALFARFLELHGVDVDDLHELPEMWRGVSWGLVEAFVQWMLRQGYAIGSINVRLSTVKTYAKLAFKAGAIDAREFALIQTVQGFRGSEAVHVDAGRTVTNVGVKQIRLLDADEVERLKFDHDKTPQGRRDAFLMNLLLDHGLRAGEAAILKVEDFDGEFMRFYRPKVNKYSLHQLTPDMLRAYKQYQPYAPKEPNVPILRASLKDGTLPEHLEGMTATGISDRVRVIGAERGIEGLSAHDCRHSWATRAARKGTDPFALQEAGGWSSLAMPRRYIAEAEIANKDVKL